MTAVTDTRIVNERFGLIRRVVQQPSPPELPGAFISYTADVADVRRAGLPRIDPWGFGAAFHDHRQAQWAAVGEAVEGYCINCIPPALRRASYRDLVRAGDNALDPAQVILYSDAQYADPRFPFVPFTTDLEVRWAGGRSLDTGEEILVPASLVYFNYYQAALASDPRTNFPLFPGIAAGPTGAAAERAALEEVIERDAVTLWWQSGASAVGIDIDSDPTVAANLTPRLGAADIDYHLVWIANAFDIPVVGAFLEDKEEGLLTFGSACRSDPRVAATKALIEAIQLRAFSLDILDRGSPIWRSVDAGINDKRCYKPYRADRRYADDFRSDYRDVIDFGGHAQLYLDPRMRQHVDHVMNPDQHLAFAELPVAREGAPYAQCLKARGFRAVSVDVTTSDVRAAGLSVVRVLVPGLYPDAPAAFPFLGGRRLYEEPVELGWVPTPLSESQLRLTPLPSI